MDYSALRSNWNKMYECELRKLRHPKVCKIISNDYFDLPINDYEFSNYYRISNSKCCSCRPHNFKPCDIPCRTYHPDLNVIKYENNVFLKKNCKEYLKNSRRKKYCNTYIKLAKVVKKKKYNKLEKLLSEGADPDASDHRGRTLLHLAACLADVRSIRILLEHHANPKAKTRYGNTPLYFAVQSGCNHAFDLLVDARSNLDEPVSKDGESFTHYLFIAIKNEYFHIVQNLLHRKASTNILSKSKKSPLLLATLRNLPEMVKTLLAHGGNPNDMELPSCRSLLMIATRECCEDVFELLIENRASANLRDQRGETALHYAMNNLEPNIVNQLLQVGINVLFRYNDGQTLFSEVNSQSPLINVEAKVKVLKLLLRSGVDLNAVSSNGSTALHHIFSKNHCQPERKICIYLDSVNALMKLGAEVDMKDKCGSTALNMAVCKDCPCMEKLLIFGADTKFMLLEGFWMTPESAKIFVQHFVKKKTAGLPVNQQCLEVARKFLRRGDSVKKFRRHCSYEVEIMRKTEFYKKITVLQFLRATKRDLKNLTNHCNTHVLLTSVLSNNQFNIYSDLLKRNMLYCKYFCLTNRAMASIDMICKSKLPIEMLEKITSYLCANHMVNLVIATNLK